jgi:hypothetical protein
LLKNIAQDAINTQYTRKQNRRFHMEAKEKLEKKNRVIEFVSKEHKYENLILAV